MLFCTPLATKEQSSNRKASPSREGNDCAIRLRQRFSSASLAAAMIRRGRARRQTFAKGEAPGRLAASQFSAAEFTPNCCTLRVKQMPPADRCCTRTALTLLHQWMGNHLAVLGGDTSPHSLRHERRDSLRDPDFAGRLESEARSCLVDPLLTPVDIEAHGVGEAAYTVAASPFAEEVGADGENGEAFVFTWARPRTGWPRPLT